MARNTPSMTRNAMERCFATILDQSPSRSAIAKLWEYFDSCCAYCGTKLDRQSRTGHLDHALASSDGGSNSIYNYVLSCGTCNGDEKRGEEWQAFLTKKVVDPDLALIRKYRIEAWISRDRTIALDSRTGVEAEQIVDRALRAFDEAIERLRLLRPGA
jgi:HNH endonuclease